MPFKSEKQRRFLFARHPKVARRWADEEKRGKKRVRERALREMAGR